MQDKHNIMDKSRATISTRVFSIVVGILSFVLTFNVYFIILRRLGIYMPAYYEASAVFLRDSSLTMLVMILSTAAVILVFGAIVISIKYIIKSEGLRKQVDRLDALILLVIFVWLLIPPFVAYYVYIFFINSILSLIFVLWFVYPSSIATVIFAVLFLLEKTEPRIKKLSQSSKKQSGTLQSQKQTKT